MTAHEDEGQTGRIAEEVAQKMAAKPRETVLSKSPLIPVGLVATIILGVVSLVWTYADAKHRIDNLENEVKALRSEYRSDHDRGRFSEDNFQEWLRLFKVSNPGDDITIPEWRP